MLDIPWYVFALLSAFFIGLSGIVEKKALAHEEPLHFSGSAMAVVGVLSIPFLFFVRWETFTPIVWLLVASIAVIAAVAFCIIAISLKRLQAGEQSLVLALAPAAAALFAFLFLGEVLSAEACIGLFLVILGLLVLEFPSAREGFRSKDFRRKIIPLALAFCAVVLYGVSAVLDRVVLTTYSVRPIDGLAVGQVIQLGLFALYGLFRGRKDHLLSSAFAKEPLKVLLFSTLLFLSRLSYLQAVSIAFVAFATALKRTSAIFTIVLARSYLHERGAGHKLLSAAIILSGVFLIVL